MRNDHRISAIECLRAVLGPQQSNQVNSFSSLTYTVPQAVDVISKGKRLLTIAPYHSASSASLTSYNSPSLWDDFWGAIGDVGNFVAGAAGKFVGGAIGLPILAASVPKPHNPPAVYKQFAQLGLAEPKPRKVITSQAYIDKRTAEVNRANKHAIEKVKIDLYKPPQVIQKIVNITSPDDF